MCENFAQETGQKIGTQLPPNLNLYSICIFMLTEGIGICGCHSIVDIVGISKVFNERDLNSFLLLLFVVTLTLTKYFLWLQNVRSAYSF